MTGEWKERGIRGYRPTAGIKLFFCGGGGGSRTRVRKCYWSRDYMLIRVHAPGITLGRSRPTLRTDKKRVPLACRSRPLYPDVAEKTSPLCDVLRRPTGEASSNGCLN